MPGTFGPGACGEAAKGRVFSIGEREASPVRQWRKYSGGQLRPDCSDVGKSRRSQRLGHGCAGVSQVLGVCQVPGCVSACVVDGDLAGGGFCFFWYRDGDLQDALVVGGGDVVGVGAFGQRH